MGTLIDPFVVHHAGARMLARLPTGARMIRRIRLSGGRQATCRTMEGRSLTGLGDTSDHNIIRIFTTLAGLHRVYYSIDLIFSSVRKRTDAGLSRTRDLVRRTLSNSRFATSSISILSGRSLCGNFFGVAGVTFHRQLFHNN